MIEDARSLPAPPTSAPGVDDLEQEHDHDHDLDNLDLHDELLRGPATRPSKVKPRAAIRTASTESTLFDGADVVEVMFTGLDSSDDEPAPARAASPVPDVTVRSRRASRVSLLSAASNSGVLQQAGDPASLLADLYLLAPEDVLGDPSLTGEQKRRRITLAFIRACSNGDIGRVRELLDWEADDDDGMEGDDAASVGSVGSGSEREAKARKRVSFIAGSPRRTKSTTSSPGAGSVRDWIDLDGRDEDGTTALIYAACWGHVDIIKILIEAGVTLDSKDKHGWTALLWACSNGQDQAAKLLIEGGASKETKSNRGRSLKDLVKRDASKQIRRILGEELDDLGKGKGRAVLDGEDGMTEDDHMRSSPSSNRDSVVSRLSIDDFVEGDKADEENIPFDWKTCRMDQMMVFDESKLDAIVSLTVVTMRPPKSHPRPVAANVIFLCARYAHYWNTQDMLDVLFTKVVAAIISEIHKHSDDAHVIAYWIANTTHLLSYLKRDDGLRATTYLHQATLSELTHELCQVLLATFERQIDQILDQAVLDHVPADHPGVRFDNAITAFGRRRSLLRDKKKRLSSSPSSIGSPSNSSPPASPVSSPRPKIPAPRRVKAKRTPYALTPASVASILTSAHAVLTHSCAHPSIVRQVIDQLLHFLSASLLNRILAHPRHHARSAAVRLRVNIEPLESWAREHEPLLNAGCGGGGGGGSSANMPPLTRHLQPVVQVLQFCQVVSSLAGLPELLETLAGLPRVTVPQCGKVMEGYRYEVGEPSIGVEVEAYVLTVLEDMRRVGAAEAGDVGEVGGVDPVEGWVDPGRLLTFRMPVFGGEEGEEPAAGKDAWAWSGASPFVPDEWMGMLDREMGREEVGRAGAREFWEEV
ncbi:hypothetical protein HK101_004857 [Irineochytrium annulatum]|nr:hypothetical protein HK101_004857 [Irineochytrium annulatum]